MQLGDVGPDLVLGRAKRRRGNGPANLLNPSFRGEEGAKRALYHCAYCAKDVSWCARIRCAACPDYDLCVECFAVGAATHPHRPGHPYRVVDDLSFPIYDPAWGADEELLLLEGVSAHGLGAWAAVASHVGGKSPDECAEHYRAVYLAAGPDPASGSGGWNPPVPSPAMTGLDADAAASTRRRARMAAAFGGAVVVASSGGGGGGGGGGGLTGSGVAGGGCGGGGGSDTPAPTTGGDAAGPTPASTGAPSSAGGPTDGHGGGGTASGAGTAADAATTSEAAGPTPAPPSVPGRPRAKGKRGRGSGRPSKGRGGSLDAKQAGVPGAPGTTAAAAAAAAAAADPAGYHPRRGEFDPEFDAAAEALLADLEFHGSGGAGGGGGSAAALDGIADDTPADTAAKLGVVSVYAARLRAREARRAFVVSRGLAGPDGAARKLAADEKKRPPAEREAAARAAAFGRLLAPADAAALGAGLLHERRLRARLAEVRAARLAGARSLADVDLFLDRARRRFGGGGGAGGAAAGPPAATGPAGPPATRGVAAAAGAAAAAAAAATVASTAAALAAAAAAVAAAAGGGHPTTSPTPRPPGAPAGPPQPQPPPDPRAAAHAAALAAAAAATASPAAAGPAGGAAAAIATASAAAAAGTPLEARGVASALAAWRARTGAGLDISTLPGVGLLSKRERALCAGARLLPAQFLAAKAALLRAGTGGSVLSRADALAATRLDARRGAAVVALVTAAGWVKVADEGEPAVVEQAAAAAAAGDT